MVVVELPLILHAISISDLYFSYGAEKIHPALPNSSLYQLCCQEKLVLMGPSQEIQITFQWGLFLLLGPIPTTK